MALWGFRATCWVTGVEWSGYPLDCYDYKSTCGDKNNNFYALPYEDIILKLANKLNRSFQALLFGFELPPPFCFVFVNLFHPAIASGLCLDFGN